MDKTSKDGVYTRYLANGDKVFLITYRVHGVFYKRKLGTDSEGWTVFKAYNERQKRIHTNTAPIAKKAHMSLDMSAEEYLISIAHKSDYKNTRGRYDNHIKTTLGHIPIDKITVNDIHKLKLELSSKVSIRTNKTLAPKTQNDVINLVNTIYIYHNKINRKTMIESPADVAMVDRLDVDNGRLKFLSKDEYKQLLWHIENRNAFTYNHNVKHHITKQLLLYTKLLVSTGIRTYSALTIRCKDINFETNAITVKNHKSNRIYTAYIHESIRDELIEVCKQLQPEFYIFGRSNLPLHRSTLNRRLKIILDKLFNEHTTDRRELVVVHTLRHTFGSWLVQNGTSLYIVSKLMNHSTMEQTQMYAKLLPHSGAEEVSRLSI